MLMRQRHRIGLLAGKMAALLLFAATVLVLVELLTIAIALVLAPRQDIAASAGRAALVVGIYVVIAGLAASLVFRRRDLAS